MFILHCRAASRRQSQSVLDRVIRGGSRARVGIRAVGHSRNDQTYVATRAFVGRLLLFLANYSGPLANKLAWTRRRDRVINTLSTDDAVGRSNRHVLPSVTVFFKF